MKRTKKSNRQRSAKKAAKKPKAAKKKPAAKKKKPSAARPKSRKAKTRAKGRQTSRGNRRPAAGIVPVIMLGDLQISMPASGAQWQVDQNGWIEASGAVSVQGQLLNCWAHVQPPGNAVGHTEPGTAVQGTVVGNTTYTFSANNNNRVRGAQGDMGGTILNRLVVWGQIQGLGAREIETRLFLGRSMP